MGEDRSPRSALHRNMRNVMAQITMFIEQANLAETGDPAGSGGTSSRRPIRQLLRAAWAYVNDGWIGDLIGAVSLMVLLWGLLVAGMVLS